MRLRLKGVALVHKRLANGQRRTYHYAWRGGPRLPGLPGSPEFMAAYLQAVKSREAPPAEPTVADLIERFRAAREMTGKAAATRREYERYLRIIGEAFGAITLRSLADLRTRGKFKEWRDGMADRPRTADYAWSVLARLMSFGVDRGDVARNPCARGGRLYKADRTEKLWSDAALAMLEATAPPEVFAVVTFALWTGQRQADCLTAKWSDIEGERIKVRQAKGGNRLVLRLGEPLQRLLATLPRTAAGTILTNSRGRAWTSAGFRASYGKVFERAGIADDLHFHDLRGTAVTRMALAGCTSIQIAAVTGHSLANVAAILGAHYLGGQAELAEQAIARLAEAPRLGHVLQTEKQTTAFSPAFSA